MIHHCTMPTKTVVIMLTSGIHTLTSMTTFMTFNGMSLLILVVKFVQTFLYEFHSVTTSSVVIFY